MAKEEWFRRNIAYVGYTAVTNDSISVPNDLREAFASGICEHKTLSRFEPITLPGGITASVSAELKRTHSTPDAILSVLVQAVLPQVRSVMEIVAMEQAGQFIDAADRRRFVASKAKELSITIDDVERILNSGYIGVPFISKFTEEHYSVGSEKGVTFTLNGGILWFSVISDRNVWTIKFFESVTTGGNANAVYAREVYDYNSRRMKWNNFDRKAARVGAMRKLGTKVAEGLEDKVKNLEPFKLTTAIEEVDGGLISFRLGVNEDVRLDDKYEIVEDVQCEDGDVVREKVGFARVSRVARRNDATGLSYARIVNRTSRIERGMLLQEHPRSSLDGRYSFRYKTITITPGKLTANGTDYLLFPEEQQLTLYMAGIGAMGNLARSLNVSQFFVTVDIFGTITQPGSMEFLGTRGEPNMALVLGAGSSMVKKFHAGPIALSLETGGNIMWFFNSNSLPDSAETGLANITYHQLLGALYGGVGLEIAMGIDYNVGVSAGYWYATPQDSWRLSARKNRQKNGDDIAFDKIDAPQIELEGLEFRVYLTQSIL